VFVGNCCLSPGHFFVDIKMSVREHHDVRTTLTLDDDVDAKLRAEARRSGRPFKQVVNEFLRLALNARRPVKHRKPFKVKARRMGLHPGLDLDNIGELLEQLEGPLHP
jgi:hypothetical protein